MATKRVYIELPGDPFFGVGKVAATVEVSDDGTCELISGNCDYLELEELFDAAREEAQRCPGCGAQTFAKHKPATCRQLLTGEARLQ